MSDQTGTNTSSEYLRWYQNAQNAPGGELELSLSETEGLFLLATTALLQAKEAAWKAHAQEGIQRLSLDRPTTPAPEPASPFMQRLTHYCGLIETIAEELRSIAPIGPVMAAGDSSKGQESAGSSPRSVRSGSLTDYPEVESWEGDLPSGSIVVDHSDDVWQRRWDGWYCAVVGEAYQRWDWDRLSSRYTLRLIHRGDGSCY